jgi:hypothetical protein
MMSLDLIRRHPEYKECDGIPIAYRGEDIEKIFGADVAPVILNGAPRCTECGIALCSCEYAYGHECEE